MNNRILMNLDLWIICLKLRLGIKIWKRGLSVNLWPGYILIREKLNWNWLRDSIVWKCGILIHLKSLHERLLICYYKIDL